MEQYQNIFNRDFYPTPTEVIETMLGMVEVTGKYCLEPSFGSGNIVRYLNEHNAREVLGCEINDTLRRGIKGCTVIGSDFLKLEADEVSHVQLIVMNPPFSRQEEHILHAWDIAPAGCEVVSLCNSSMMRGYTSKQREIESIINNYGYSEDLGNVFSTSDERRTDCNITMIRIVKPGHGNMEFDGYFTDEADEPEMQGNGIIPYNAVREAVQRYVAAVSKVDAVLEASNAINDLTKEFEFSGIKFGMYKPNGNNYDNLTKDYFKKALQKAAWRWVFRKFKMDKYVTTSVLETVNKAVEMQSNMPFTMKNVYRMIEMIIGTHADRMQQVVLDAFDTICRFSEENTTYVEEKWKTNSAHMVNKKFIVPYICEYDSRWPEEHVKISYGSRYNVDLDDIVKAMCFITGTPYEREYINENGERKTEAMPCLRSFCYEHKMWWGEWYDWTFFRIKGFKKGTMHVEFKDDEQWAMFNQAVAKVRGWELPAKVKVKKGARK